MPIKVGDLVTCKVAVPAYYSDCYGNPRMTFEPGMTGVVVAISPKVCVVSGESSDRRQHFLVVDFLLPPHGTQRTGLNFCNAVKTKEIS